MIVRMFALCEQHFEIPRSTARQTPAMAFARPKTHRDARNPGQNRGAE
jgi:hypothetical protein